MRVSVINAGIKSTPILKKIKNLRTTAALPVTDFSSKEMFQASQ